jgi:hypothetical protein
MIPLALVNCGKKVSTVVFKKAEWSGKITQNDNLWT